MKKRHVRGGEAAEKHEDVPQSPTGKLHGAVQQRENDEQNDGYPARVQPVPGMEDVIRHVKRRQDDRKQRYDGQREILFHRRSVTGEIYSRSYGIPILRDSHAGGFVRAT